MQKKRSSGKRKKGTDIGVQNPDDITMMMKIVIVTMSESKSASELVDITIGTMRETKMTGGPKIERTEKGIILVTATRVTIGLGKERTREGKESCDTAMIAAKKGTGTATGEKSGLDIILRMICRAGSMRDHEPVRNHLVETIGPVNAMLEKCWTRIL